MSSAFLRKSAPFLLLLPLLILGVLLPYGSIHNSDDALYAQITRQVAEGRFFPLFYANQEFLGKPPLFFWISSLFVKVLGDRDFSYRVFPFLSLILLVGAAYLALKRNYGSKKALLVSAALFTSPLLLEFSRRVMIDLPLSMVFFLIILSAWKRSWFWFLALSFIGFLLKEIAVLPVIAATTLVTFRSERRNPKFWTTFCLLFCGLFFLHWSLGGMGSGVSPGVNAATSDVLRHERGLGLYFDVLRMDSFLVWMAIPAFFFLLWKRPKGELTYSIFLSAFFWLIAMVLAPTRLPHYALPLTVFLILGSSMAFLQLCPSRYVKWFSVLIFLQIALNLLPYLSLDQGLLDPAKATKETSMAFRKVSKTELPFCVINTYPVGFRFYSGHPVLAVFTSGKGYEAVHRIRELRPITRHISASNLSNFTKTECSPYFVLPENQARNILNLEVVKESPPLQLVRWKN